jgi:hypoxanthine phosphoribosyltransferase
MSPTQPPIAPPIERHPDVAHILLAPEEIARRVGQLGVLISQDYAERDPLLVGVLKGVVPFLADLSRAITIPHMVDFLAICPFAQRGECGTVRILKDLEESAAGRHVLLVEDIVDTGLTLHYLMRWLRERNPASAAICTLLDRPRRRLVNLPVIYRGFKVPNHFLVGYGLDYQELYRHLPYVGILRPEIYLPD